MSLISLICKLFELQLFTALWLAAVGMYLLDVVTLIWEMRRCAVSLFIFCFGAEVLTTFFLQLNHLMIVKLSHLTKYPNIGYANIVFNQHPRPH